MVAAVMSVPMKEVQDRYVAVLLPRIEAHCAVCCRGRSGDEKEEMVSEASALGWKWYLRLVERGKDASQFPAAFTTLVAKAVKSGRKLTGMNKATDAMNRFTQIRHGFRVERLPTSTCAPRESLYGLVGGQRLHDEFEEMLRDNVVSAVPDQVQFRIDFPAWLATLTSRERKIVEMLGRNERTSDVARRFGVSPAAISQRRQKYREDWQRFTDDEPASAKA